MSQATTLDLFIYDTAVGYKNLLAERANNPHQAPDIPQEELLGILEKARQGNGSKK